MKVTRSTLYTRAILMAVTSIILSLVVSASAFAHCDTVNGPIIPEARTALEKGDVHPVLKWVKKEHESEITVAFTRAVEVRDQGPAAKELADQYFLETLVRIHRAGEGAPYTGIKDEPVDPIVAMTDQALAEGSADELIKKVGDHLAAGIREKFNRVNELRKRKDENVEAGREFVEAYVAYTHYVEGVHTAIASAGAHPHADAAEASAPAAAGTEAHHE